MAGVWHNVCQKSQHYHGQATFENTVKIQVIIMSVSNKNQALYAWYIPLKIHGFFMGNFTPFSHTCYL